MSAEPIPTTDRPSGSDDDVLAKLRPIVQRMQVQYRTVADHTYDVIREAIVTGAFGPGTRLRQDELADAIGVSRMPVRSALLQLETEGLVDFFAHRGAVVRALTESQIREIYELRSLLETFALRKAMRNMTPQRLQWIEDAARRVDSAHEGSAFSEARVDFYHQLYGRGEHSLLLEYIDGLRSRVGSQMLGHRVVGSADHRHEKILEYIRQGNEEAAVAWLQIHLADVCDALIKRVQTE